MFSLSAASLKRSALVLGVCIATAVPLMTPGTANAYWYRGGWHGYGYGWRGYGWHGYGWRAYGWRPYGWGWGWRPGVVVAPPVVVGPPAIYIAP
jgi:hypothetical protein